MKTNKIIFLVAGFGMFLTPAFAIPLDISLTPVVPPVHDWGNGISLYGTDFQDEDIIQASGEIGFQPTINLTGVNSISVTWNAPAGYMYVVAAPPSAIGTLNLEFGLEYGGAAAASLGSMTSSSVSMNLINGNPQTINRSSLNNGLLKFYSTIFVAPNSPGFAFNSLTIMADFNGTAPSGTLTVGDFGNDASGFFGILFGDQTFFSIPYNGPPDPGQLSTQAALPGGSVPDESSSLVLAGLSGVSLLVFRRKFC